MRSLLGSIAGRDPSLDSGGFRIGRQSANTGCWGYRSDDLEADVRCLR
jgi:hypothetical protein